MVLTWTDAFSLTAYSDHRRRWRLAGTSQWQPWVTGITSSHTITDGGLTPGASHNFQVSSFTNGHWTPSATATATVGAGVTNAQPTDPGAPVATNITSSGCTATCAPSTDTDLIGYRWQIATDSPTFVTKVAATPPTSASNVTQLAIPPSTPFVLFVEAFDSINQANPSGYIESLVSYQTLDPPVGYPDTTTADFWIKVGGDNTKTGKDATTNAWDITALDSKTAGNKLAAINTLAATQAVKIVVKAGAGSAGVYRPASPTTIPGNTEWINITCHAADEAHRITIVAETLLGCHITDNTVNDIYKGDGSDAFPSNTFTFFSIAGDYVELRGFDFSHTRSGAINLKGPCLKSRVRDCQFIDQDARRSGAAIQPGHTNYGMIKINGLTPLPANMVDGAEIINCHFDDCKDITWTGAQDNSLRGDAIGPIFGGRNLLVDMCTFSRVVSGFHAKRNAANYEVRNSFFYDMEYCANGLLSNDNDALDDDPVLGTGINLFHHNIAYNVLGLWTASTGEVGMNYAEAWVYNNVLIQGQQPIAGAGVPNSMIQVRSPGQSVNTPRVSKLFRSYNNIFGYTVDIPSGKPASDGTHPVQNSDGLSYFKDGASGDSPPFSKAFTLPLVAANSATLTAPFPIGNLGAGITYNLGAIFSDLSFHTATLTTGSTAISWDGAPVNGSAWVHLVQNDIASYHAEAMIALQDYNCWRVFRVLDNSRGVTYVGLASAQSPAPPGDWRNVTGFDMHSKEVTDLGTVFNTPYTFASPPSSPADFHLLESGAAHNTGRIGGVSSGAACDMGAWDGATQIGCSF